MTTKTITNVVEDIPAYNPQLLKLGPPKDILDLINGTPAILPAGNAIYEIEVRLTGNPLINPDTFYIGLFAPTAEFTSYYAFSATDINTYGYASSILSVQYPNQHLAVNADTHIQIQATGRSLDIIGKLYIVVKYKPISIGEHHF